MSELSTVLITGASSGIGYEIAKVFAENKYNLVLVARSSDKLKELAEKLIHKYNIKVNIIVQDLSVPGAAGILFNKVEYMSIEIDILVNNAGVGNVGLFHEIPLSKHGETIGLNIVTLTEMTKLFTAPMIKRKKGKILNLASTGSFHPGPFTAVYYATKAYVLSFSEALYRELKPYNITVTAICPGATSTNFSKRAGRQDTKGAMNPSIVARAAYNGLLRNKRVVVPGVLNKIWVKLPRSLTSKMVAKYQQMLSLKDK